MDSNEAVWLLSLRDKDDRQVYTERDETDRYDEAPVRVGTLAAADAYRTQWVGRFGWVWTDAGEWRRGRVAAVALHELVGGRFYPRTW